MENQLAKLTNLFDSQIATLIERGTPEQIVELLANRRGSVISKASEMTFENGHVPFLPVIPLTYRSVYDLMPAVHHDGEVGYTNLDPTRIADKFERPGKPYYIYGVEDGESTRGMSPEAAQKVFRHRNRLPLTVAEAIALITHTDVLSQHSLWIVGSQYGSADWVLSVSLYRNQPKLEECYIDDSHPRYGSPFSVIMGKA